MMYCTPAIPAFQILKFENFDASDTSFGVRTEIGLQIATARIFFFRGSRRRRAGRAAQGKWPALEGGFAFDDPDAACARRRVRFSPFQ